jgi:hypothetical protein
MQVPKTVKITDRLYNDIMILYKLTKETGKESGGMLIIGAHGHLGVVSLVEGEDKEIVLEPEEELFENERYVGTFHCHPITDLPSTGDVISYLEDEFEKVMIVCGEDKSVNMCVKTSKTPVGDFSDELEEYEQEDMVEIADKYFFLFYRGYGTELTLQNEPKGFQSLPGVKDVEELLKDLGIEGLPMYPEEYSTKKQ